MGNNELLRNGSGYIDPTAYEALKAVQKGQEMSYNNDIKRGDIYYIYLSEYTGSEQKGGRPGIVVSNDIGNAHAPIISVVYLTTQEKKPLPTHAAVYGTQESIALCEQVYTVSKSKVGAYITSCSPKEMEAVDEALAVALGLENYSADAEPKIKELQDALEELTERAKEREEVVKRLEEQLMLSADDENISVYEPEYESFYKRFYDDLFHSGKKIEIKVGC